MIEDKVKELLEPLAKEREYFVVDVSYRREGRKFALRVTVDKRGGITIDECGRLNKELSELLDEENIIEDEYILEVSSPGADRKLKTDQDFVWAVGKRARITTYAPLEGKSAFLGVLVGLGDGTVVVDEDGAVTEIPREKIASARLSSYGEDKL